MLEKSFNNIQINADDFGLSDNVNKAVVECFQKKYISTTTIIMNMENTDRAVNFSREFDFVDKVGLHLNILEGYPLSDAIKKCQIFCNEEGMFNDTIWHNSMKMFFLSYEEKKALRKEMEMQIDKYFSYGFEGHLDSHKHTHTIWSIFQELNKLLQKNKFKTIRLSENVNKNINLKKKTYKTVYNQVLKYKFNISTNYFTSFDIAQDVGLPKNGVVELMCHPDYDNKGKLINVGSVGFEEFYNTFQKAV